jgi:hypothetical protein
MKRITFLIALVTLLLLAGSALAMDSETYSLDWFTPMTGSGGGANSANYAASFTVGQSAIGDFSSTNYESCLGYWCGIGVGEYRIYLPLTLRNS